ncbi:hypothetical protein GCM10010315_32710 [Streptomyces luteosporeus]|uniref:DUF6777 domain-containing protein n=1 Tax=Streptomyces luteosporeus TaxID=173856 RepID=A0ABP6GB21_9ACTN
MLVAAALAVFFLRQSGSSGGEVLLQAAGSNGRDPFTQSTAKDYGSSASAHPAIPAGGGSGPHNIAGNTAGLYGGSRNHANCDVERQIGYLTQDQNKSRAFAGVVGIDPGGLTGYLRGLTPLQLRSDTRVTNHGYKDGSVTSFQSVLQAGTAVLVDDRGLPRVRCTCGNPLTPPVAVQGTPKATGDTWPAYKYADVVVVTPADSVMDAITVYDPDTGEWFERPVGTDGDQDRSVSPPKGGMSSSAPGKSSAPPPPGSSRAPQPPPPPASPHTPPASPRTTPPTTPPSNPSPPPAYGPPPVRAY